MLGVLKTIKKSLLVTSGSVAETVEVAKVVVVRVDRLVVVIVEDGGVIVPSGIKMLVPLPGRVLVRLLVMLEVAGGSVWLVSEVLLGLMVLP